MRNVKITLLVQAENWTEACDVIAESINDVIDGQPLGQRVHDTACCQFTVEEVFCGEAPLPEDP